MLATLHIAVQAMLSMVGFEGDLAALLSFPCFFLPAPITGTGRDDGTFRPVMDALLNGLQWPAMIVTLTAAWLVASRSSRKRTVGFWCFIVSNILWIVWGLHDEAYALIGLQVGLFALNLRGVKKNDPELS
jgi:hypothetical protein